MYYFRLQLKLFQKKKTSTGTKKKKKKDRSSTSGSAQSPSPGRERRRRSSSQDRAAAKIANLEAALALEEKVPKQDGEDVEVEEISQADTDRDAPSIASELGSPIPFDVSL